MGELKGNAHPDVRRGKLGCMTRWRLHIYRQGPDDWTEPARDTFAEVHADLERVGGDEDWVYIERQQDGGEWVRVAFAGGDRDLPDAWTFADDERSGE